METILYEIRCSAGSQYRTSSMYLETSPNLGMRQLGGQQNSRPDPNTPVDRQGGLHRARSSRLIRPDTLFRKGATLYGGIGYFVTPAPTLEYRHLFCLQKSTGYAEYERQFYLLSCYAVLCGITDVSDMCMNYNIRPICYNSVMK